MIIVIFWIMSTVAHIVPFKSPYTYLVRLYTSFQVSIYSHLFSRITSIYNNGKKKKKEKNKGKVATYLFLYVL